MNWTDEQQAVIDHSTGHAIVTAVAGSGKTSTLVAHVLRQLERGHDPARMLVLMFNRSAKEDFARKLAKAGHEGLILPDIRTYHSMGLRLYKYFAEAGLLPRWQGDPLSNARMDYECWKILTRIAPANMAESLKSDKSSWISELTGFIELVKSTIHAPEQVFEDYGFSVQKKLLLEGYHAFEQWRQEQGLITYADMLYQPVMLMVKRPDLVQRVTDRMDLMLVDEYQDTNEVQHTLLKIIAGRRAQVIAVGDPDQTIYEFRGARPEYILKTFAEDFPISAHYQLSYTFRYGHILALVADHLITRNGARGDTLCIAHNTTPQTEVKRIESNNHGHWLVSRVVDLNDKGRSFSEITVLVRLWSQTVNLELALLEANVPFISEAERSAFDRQEIQVQRALLALAAGRYQGLNEKQRYDNLWLILRFPHIGIRDDWLKPFCSQLSQQADGFGRQIMKLSQTPLPGLSDFQKNKLQERGRLLAQLEKGEDLAAHLLSNYQRKVSLKSWLLESALDRDKAEEQLRAIDSFNGYLASTGYGAAEACDFIDDLNVRQTQRGRRKRGEALLLTSMHRSKGLEWPVVILPSLLEGQIPCSHDKTLDQSVLESERRLFYVAMTRAREELYLVTVNPASAEADRSPSRFMAELHDKLSCEVGRLLHEGLSSQTVALDYHRSEVVEKYMAHECPQVRIEWKKKGSVAYDTFHSVSTPWQKKKVIHSIFGEGVVLSETSTDFKVRFLEDGSARDFSKKSAHLYFR